MKITKELRALSPEQLLAKTEEFKKEILKLRGKSAASGNPADSQKLRNLRKNIARALTIQNGRN